MKEILEIHRLAFTYRVTSLLIIVCHLFYAIFNLISLALFIPFLKIIFIDKSAVGKEISEPIYQGGFVGFFRYISKYYNYFMESMAANDPKKALYFVCVSVFIAFLFKNIFRYGVIWSQSFLRMAVTRDIRARLFEKSLNLPLSFYSEERKGDLMSRMNSDVGEIEVAVVSVLELVYREPITIVISIAFLLNISPQLTLFSFILLPLSALVISRIGKSLKRTAVQGQHQMGVLNSALEEGLGAIRIIKAFNAIPQVLSSFNKINLRHQQLLTRMFRKKELSSPLNETLGAFVLVSIVWFGGTMILADEKNASLSGAEFITFIVMFSQLLRPIQGVANSVGYINKAKVSLDRITAIFDTDEKIYEAENPIQLMELKESIRFQNVSFRYKDEFVLKDINFTIPQGKSFALVGESGSGKSTISDLLPRFYDVNEGSIFYDSVNIKEASVTDLRNHIGIVSQESILFNDTVRNNIAFGTENASEEEIVNAAKIANAHEFILNLESGYDTNIGERGNKLSGGQKQRMSIARAVLKNPSIMILDEATSALDTESEKLVQDALEKLMKNRTSLVIAHRLSTIRNADNILVLSKGEIKETGTHEELIAKKGLYYNLCTMQGYL
ncbi:MAG: ABC transporter ATP-binding protein [Flavobacteriia bacterium]|nr:ABC transporter ATP-binding protein [Flavobacteriia bacterium]